MTSELTPEQDTWRVVTTMLLLWVLDISTFYIFGVTDSLFHFSHHLLFVAQGFGLAALGALVLLGLSAGRRRVWARLKTRVEGRGRWLAIVLPSVFLMGLALVVTGKGTGSGLNLAPWPIALLSLLPGLGVGVLTWVLTRGGEKVERTAVASFLSMGFSLWMAAGYAGLILNGRFGLNDKSSMLRSGMLFGSVFTLIVFGVLFAHRSRVIKTRPWTLFGASLGLALAALLNVINAMFMVDLYLELHLGLILVTILLSWHVAHCLVHGFQSEGWPGQRRVIASVALCAALGAVGLVSAGAGSVVRYVGAIHTVQQRFALELLYNGAMRIHHLPGELFDTIENRLLKRRGWAFPVDDGPLPSTFSRLEPDPSLSRPEADTVVLFLLDMQKPESFGHYGRSPSITPHIDERFAGAFVFENSYAGSNHTSATYPTLYTSTYGGTRHQDLSTMTVRPSWFGTEEGANLGTVFSKAGFDTVLLTNDWYMRELFAPAHKRRIFGGFQTLFAEEGDTETTTTRLREGYEKSGGLVSDRERSLIVVHIFAHGEDEMAEIDDLIEEVCQELERAGRLDRSVLLLTADHGIQYREHGRTSYGVTLFDEEVRVPLLMRVPGMTGRHIESPVSSLDILPTVVDLVGIPLDFEVEGRSLLPKLHKRPWDEARPIFIEARRDFHSVAVVVGSHKLIWWSAVGVYALFDLESDPGEFRNVAEDPDYADTFIALKAHLDRFSQERDEETWPTFWIPKP